MGEFSFRNQWSPFKIDGKKWHRMGGFVSAICCNSMRPPIWIIQPNIVPHALCVALDHVCLCSAHSSAAGGAVMTHPAVFLWSVVAWDEKMLLEEVVEEPVGPGVWRLLDDTPCTVECPLQVLGWFFFGYESYQIFYFLFPTQATEPISQHSYSLFVWFSFVWIKMLFTHLCLIASLEEDFSF